MSKCQFSWPFGSLMSVIGVYFVICYSGLILPTIHRTADRCFFINLWIFKYYWKVRKLLTFLIYIISDLVLGDMQHQIPLHLYIKYLHNKYLVLRLSIFFMYLREKQTLNWWWKPLSLQFFLSCAKCEAVETWNNQGGVMSGLEKKNFHQ